MRFQALTQIVLVLIAVALVFLVIKPKLEAAQEMQKEVDKYETAINNANEYYGKLNELKARQDTISSSDLLNLNTYMPTQIDVLRISNDLATMVERSGLLLQDISADETDTQSTMISNPGSIDDTFTVANEDPLLSDPALIDPTLGEVDSAASPLGTASGSIRNEALRSVVTREFTVSMFGTYDDFKAFLINLEANKYQLRIKNMSFESSEESDLIEFSVVLSAFALSENVSNTNRNQ